MSSMNVSSPKLSPFPHGSVYFAQMHALRWAKRRDEECFKTLYNEILGHALFYGALIVTDSHALQNWWLLNLLQNPRAFPGIKEAFQKGIIRVAKRKGASLTEIAHSQLGEVPVVVEGKLTKMTKDFIPHAATLEKLTKEQILEFDVAEMNLEQRVCEDVLLDAETREAYGINESTAEFILRKIKMLVEERGRLYARDLFDLPTKFPKKLGQYGKAIRNMATSVHSFNFPLTYGIYPVVSPAAFDYESALVFLRNKLIYRHITRDQVDFLSEFIVHPEKTVEGIQRIRESRGIDVGLSFKLVRELRDSREFKEWLKALHKLLEATKARGEEESTLRLSEAREAAFWALSRYLLRISSSLGLPSFEAMPEKTPSHWVLTKSMEIESDIERVKRQSAVLGSVITALLGVMPYLGPYAGVYPFIEYLKIVVPLSFIPLSVSSYLRLTKKQKQQETLFRLSYFLNIFHGKFGEEKPTY